MCSYPAQLASIPDTIGFMFALGICLLVFLEDRKERFALLYGEAIFLSNSKYENREWTFLWAQIQIGRNDLYIKTMRRCTLQDLLFYLTVPGERPISVAAPSLCSWVPLQKKQVCKGSKAEKISKNLGVHDFCLGTGCGTVIGWWEKLYCI